MFALMANIDGPCNIKVVGILSEETCSNSSAKNGEHIQRRSCAKLRSF